MRIDTRYSTRVKLYYSSLNHNIFKLYIPMNGTESHFDDSTIRQHFNSMKIERNAAIAFLHNWKFDALQHCTEESNVSRTVL